MTRLDSTCGLALMYVGALMSYSSLILWGCNS